MQSISQAQTLFKKRLIASLRHPLYHLIIFINILGISQNKIFQRKIELNSTIMFEMFDAKKRAESIEAKESVGGT